MYKSSNGICYPRFLNNDEIIFLEYNDTDSVYNLIKYNIITKTKYIIERDVEDVLPPINNLGEILYVKYDNRKKIFKFVNGKKTFICNGTYPIWSNTKNGIYFYANENIYYLNFYNRHRKTIKNSVMIDGTPALSKDDKYMALIILTYPWTPGAMRMNYNSYILNLKTKTMFKVSMYNDSKLSDISLTYGMEFMDEK